MGLSVGPGVADEPLPETATVDGSHDASRDTVQATPDELPERFYQDWLLQVEAIASPREQQVFAELTDSEAKEAFIEAFWRARDADPETPSNRLRERFERHLQGAWNTFPNLRDERAKMALLHGPPRYTHVIQCPVLVPLHLFFFPRTAQREMPFKALFTVSNGEPDRLVLWPAERGASYLARDATFARLPLDELLARASEAGCFRGQEQVRGFLEGTLEAALTWQQAYDMAAMPKDDRWLDDFVAGQREPSARPSGTLEVLYPARQGQRTLLQGLMRLPKHAVQARFADLQTVAAPQATGMASSFLFTGLLERLDAAPQGQVVIPRQIFRQRLQWAPGAESIQITDGTPNPSADELSLFFHLDLVPGAYRLTTRLEDPAGGLLLRDFRQLEVPVEVTAGGMESMADALQMAPENLALLANRPSVQILPLPGLQVGSTTIDVVTSGHGITSLRFALDGQPIGISTASPWSLEIDLGLAPQPRTVQVTAMDGAGKVLARDSLRVNTGAHRFAVRLLEPQAGDQPQNVLRTQAAVEVPAGATLDRVEFFLEERLLATFYQPPFFHMLALDEAQGPSYVKATAYLTDGSSTSDLAVINVPGEVDEIDVRQIELFANVFDRRRRPVNDLGVEDFQVAEEGKSQTILKVERVQDLPVHVALLIDTSKSMLDELPVAIESALHFFDTTLTEEDQAAVITFNHGTHLAVPFTRDLDWLADGVSTVTAYGGTALWDSTIGSLHYFGGLPGKRAMVLLSDGEDEHSRFDFKAAREFAQRSGVAIYTISLDVAWEIPNNDMPGLDTGGDTRVGSVTQAWELKDKQHRRRLERLSEESGGLFFKIKSIKTLDKAFGAIEDDMRSQYLITYQSSHQGSDFRRVELKSRRQGTKVRAIGGYYP